MISLLQPFFEARPEQPRIIHFLDMYAQGVSDRGWATRIATEKWLPITADRGKSNIGEKLPRVLRELGVVHVTLSPTVHSLRMDEKFVAITGCWLQIVAAWREQRGCEHVIRMNSRRDGFHLIDVEASRRRPPPAIGR